MRKSFLILLFFTLFYVCGCSKAVVDPNTLYKEAADNFHRGNLSACSKKLDEIDKISPNNYEVLCLRGMVKGRQGKIEESLDLFSKAIKTNPKRFAAYSYYGDVMKSLNMTPFAKEYYEKTISLCDTSECRNFFRNELNKMLETEKMQSQKQTENLLTIQKYKVPKLDGRKWKTGNIGFNSGHVIAEFVLENESIQNWSEIYTQEVLYKEAFDISIDNFLRKTSKLNRQTGENLGRKYYENIIWKKPDETLYTWGYGSGHENNIFYLKSSKDALFKLSYAKKSTFSSEEIKKWEKIFKQ